MSELPEGRPDRGDHAGRYRRTAIEREHVVVVRASFFDARELRNEECEAHGDSSNSLKRGAVDRAFVQFTRAEVLGRAGGTCAARRSGEASGVQRERTASHTGTRLRVGHRELLRRLRPIRVEWTWVTACRCARHSARENGVSMRRREPMARRAESSGRMRVTTHASKTVANRRDAREETAEATAARTVCLLAGRRLGKNPGGRRAGQAETLFEGRLLQLSKAYAPFVKTFGF